MCLNIEDKADGCKLKCNAGKECSVEHDYGKCIFESYIAREIIFVKTTKQQRVCCFKMSFGDSFICNCEKRKQYYSKIFDNKVLF